MSTETETITKEELNALPKKQLLIMAKELELNLPNSTLKDDVINAIMEVYSDADEAADGLEAEQSDQFNAVKSARSSAGDDGKQLIDVKTMTFADLEAMRPDLITKARKTAPKAADIDSDKSYAKLQKWNVKIGVIGPLTVEAYTRSDALQKFCEQAGINGFSNVKPIVSKVK